MQFVVSRRRVFWFLTTIAIVLTLLSCATRLIGFLTGHARLMGFGRLFNVGAEQNIPTWYSSIGLLLAAVLLAVIATAKLAQRDRFSTHWVGLSVGFLLMSIDEMCSIHETLGAAMEHLLDSSSKWLYLGWVTPVAIGVFILGLAYTRFMIALPPATRRLFLIACVIYLGSAMGLEGIGGIWRTAHGQNNLPYMGMVAIEEMGEMLGVAIFIYALIWYLSVHVESITIRLAESRELQPQADDEKPSLLDDLDIRSRD